MSYAAMTWAWEQEVPKASAKLVLLCLADCHNAENGACFPSHSHIAKQTGLNIKTVPGAIQYLGEIGLLSTEKRRGAKTQYALELHPKTGTPKNGTTPKNGYTQKRVPTTPKNGESPPPKTGTEPVSNQERTKKHRSLSLVEVPESLTVPVCEFIDHRCNLKKPLTQEALSRFMIAVDRASAELGLPKEFVISETIDAGWQSVKPDWLRRRLGGPHATRQQPDNHDSRSAVGRVRAARERAAGMAGSVPQ